MCLKIVTGRYRQAQYSPCTVANHRECCSKHCLTNLAHRYSGRGLTITNLAHRYLERGLPITKHSRLHINNSKDCHEALYFNSWGRNGADLWILRESGYLSRRSQRIKGKMAKHRCSKHRLTSSAQVYWIPQRGYHTSYLEKGAVSHNT